jgi:hypothetical protein
MTEVTVPHQRCQSIGNYSAYPRCQFPMLVTVKRAKNDRSNYRSLLVHAGIGMEESRCITKT